MSVFILLLVIGLTGLVFMALPALGHGHGHDMGGHTGHIAHSHDIGHILGDHLAHGHTHAAPTTQAHDAPHAETGTIAGLIPSPRTLFSLLAIYGAFGNLLDRQFHLPMNLASIGALLPAYLIERCAVTPLWKFMLQFTSRPSAPLQTLTLQSAEAVTPFANGKGIVQAEREGRMVQFTAYLTPEQSEIPVRVGDRLIIEEVDPESERLKVRIR